MNRLVQSALLALCLCTLWALAPAAANNSVVEWKQPQPESGHAWESWWRDDWRTKTHSPGYCAMYGTCGHRESDNDLLDCAKNDKAQPLSDSGRRKLQQVCPKVAEEVGPEGAVCCTEEQLDVIQSQTQIASIFLVGCPACNHNFKHFFCMLTCSPDQATFANVTTVQTGVGEGSNFTNAVAEIDVFLSPKLGEAFYGSCDQTIYAPTNMKAMNFVGGGAKNYQEWVDFLGLVKDKRTPKAGSPFQINFPSVDQLPEGMEAMKGSMAPCGEGPLQCSCADCPSGSSCAPPEPPPPPLPSGCPYLHTPGPLTCLDLTFIGVYALILACIPSFVRFAAACGTDNGFDGADGAATPLSRPLLQKERSEGVEEIVSSGAAATPMPAPPSNSPAADVVEYPATEQLLRQGFYRLGLVCAARPWRTLGVAALCILLCMLGMLRLQVVTEPAKLWVGPDSQAAAERAAYESAFGPFYRITQLILSTPNGSDPIVTDANIRLLFDMQAEIDALSVAYPGGGDSNETITLSDLCFKPFGDFCATQSVIQYWHGSRAAFEGQEGPRVAPEVCFEHWSVSCRAATGAPVDPKVVLGGFPRSGNVTYATDATAFVTTLPLSSSSVDHAAALAWEAAFIGLCEEKLAPMAAKAGLEVSFSTERSVEDEMTRERSADAGTVVKSYLLMTLYVAIALGRLPRSSGLRAAWRNALVYGRVTLALGGVLIVAASVGAALGLCGWAGIGATLIIFEVIPFLVLAVGVDNVFILTQAADRLEKNLGGATRPQQRAAAALAATGPSMLLAATAETCGFAVGTLTSMPALQTFAACAAAAIAIDFLLQITVFPAMLALDAIRVQESRYDCMPWVKAPTMWTEDSEGEEEGAAAASGGGEGEERSEAGGPSTSSVVTPQNASGDRGGGGSMLPTAAMLWAAGAAHEEVEGEEEGVKAWGVGPALQFYMKRVHAPLLLRPWIKGAVVALFTGLFLFSCALLPRLEKGLNQRVALPQDSYLQRYFADVADLLRVGPPISFVVQDLNVSSDSPDIARVCSSAGCAKNSLLNRISAGARTPWQSWLAGPASSWLDDFLAWVSPEIPQCCRVFPEDWTPCPPPDQPPCVDDEGQPTGQCDACQTCFSPEDFPPGVTPRVPSPADFADTLPQFLAARPSAQCAKGGVGAYSDALERDPRDSTDIAGLSNGTVAASAFMAYYLPLSAQRDFIEAMSATRELAERAKSELSLHVFTYSIFHVFFEQYLTLGGEAMTMLGSAAVAVFVLCLIATGSPGAAAIVLCVLSMLCVDLAGVMVLTGIQANAVSLVNLAAAVGIGVEFCVHVVHAFMEAPGTRDQRAAMALRSVGAAVLSGITLTKLIGVAVLASAHTAIFRIYFFKFYLGLVVLGAAHGLVFLPVVLSVVGPEAFHHWRVGRVAKLDWETTTM